MSTSEKLGRANCMVIWAPVILIRCYQVVIRPHLIGSCKFCPTCSEYSIEALQRHGLMRGTLLALRRIVRCHPFGAGGVDPVPTTDVPLGLRERIGGGQSSEHRAQAP